MNYEEFIGIDNRRKYLAYRMENFTREDALSDARKVLHEAEKSLQVECGCYDEDGNLSIGVAEDKAEFWVVSRVRKRRIR